MWCIGYGLILVLDFGSQYTQLIARRIREIGVYSLVKPYNIPINEIIRLAPKGIIFSGGPNSVNTRKMLKPNKKIFSLGIPILGICYGMQLIAREFDGKVVKSLKKEFGHSTFNINKKSQARTKLKKRFILKKTFLDLFLYIQQNPRRTLGTGPEI